MVGYSTKVRLIFLLSKVRGEEKFGKHRTAFPCTVCTHLNEYREHPILVVSVWQHERLECAQHRQEATAQDEFDEDRVVDVGLSDIINSLISN